MKTIFLLTALLMAVSNGYTQVLIYRSSERETGVAGSGTAYSGYWVLDLATTNFVYIHKYHPRINWRVLHDYPIATGSVTGIHLTGLGTDAKPYTVLTAGGVSTVQGDYAWSSFLATGPNRVLKIATGKTNSVPKTMTCRLAGLARTDASILQFSQLNASLVFSQPMTVAANDAGEDAQDVISNLRDRFIKLGHF